MSLKAKLIKLKKGVIETPRSRATDRREWVEAIADLYETIERYLDPLISDALVKIEREPIQRYEDKYGPYKTERLTLVLPGEKAKVVFEPVAGDGLGHRGRVDVFRYGFYTEGVWLLRMGGDPEKPNWMFVDRAPRATGHSLSRKTLETVIGRLIGA
jgi:hypothetical protein